MTMARFIIFLVVILATNIHAMESKLLISGSSKSLNSAQTDTDSMEMVSSDSVDALSKKMRA